MTSRRNLASNPQIGDNGDYYLATAFPNSPLTSGSIGPITSAPVPELAGAGMWTTKGTSTTATAGQTMGVNYEGVTELPITPGQFVTASIYGRGHSSAAALKLQMTVAFLNAAGAEIGGTAGTATSTTNNAWTRFSASSGAAPAGTVRARLRMTFTTTATFALNDSIDVSGLLVEVGASSAPSVGTLFIPGVTAGAYWEGTPEASPSQLYAFAGPTVTTTTDPPSAHIIFTAAALASDVARITLYELHDGTQRSVRTAVDAFAAGGIVVDDLEPPRGTTVTYKAEAFRADGTSVGFTPGTDVFIPSEVGIGYLSNPLDPATPALRVEFRSTVGTGGKTDAPGALYRVGLRTVALLAQRGLLRDVDLSFFTDTLGQYQAVRKLVDDSNGLLLFRVDPPIALPRLMYFWAKGIVWDEFDQPDGLEDFEWDNVVDQISPIEGAPSTSVIPWQIYVDAFPLWSDMNAAYLTWLDAMNNPPEA